MEDAELEPNICFYRVINVISIHYFTLHFYLKVNFLNFFFLFIVLNSIDLRFSSRFHLKLSVWNKIKKIFFLFFACLGRYTFRHKYLHIHTHIHTQTRIYTYTHANPYICTNDLGTVLRSLEKRHKELEISGRIKTIQHYWDRVEYSENSWRSE